MALNLGRIQQFLATEDPWRASLGSTAPVWARCAIDAGLALPKRISRTQYVKQQKVPMVPLLEGRLATIGLSDWQLLGLWVVWMGPRFRERDAGGQLVQQVECGWVDFKAWLWEKFGL